MVTESDNITSKGTVVFLDVDGVVAPFPAGSEHWGDWEDIRQRARLPLHVESGFPCHLSKTMGKALAALDAELVWLTTWEDLANQLIAPYFDWEPLRVLYQNDYAQSPWWKYNAIHAHIQKDGRPFVWADDDMATDPVKVPDSCPSLLIAPLTEVGLMPQDLDAMALFVESVSCG